MKCRICNKKKDTSEFWKKGFNQGRQRYALECKPCSRIIENQKIRKRPNRFQNPLWMKRHRKKYPNRVKIKDIVKQAKKKGILIPQPCEVCSNKNVEAHHDDYSKPLKVRWLCRLHHKELSRL